MMKMCIFTILASALLAAGGAGAKEKHHSLSIRRVAEDGQTYWWANSSDGKTISGQAGCNSSFKACTSGLTGTIVNADADPIQVDWQQWGMRSIPRSSFVIKN